MLSQAVGAPVSASPNQRVADAIADKLNHSPMLNHFRVTVTFQNGEADLAGTVLTQTQRAEALNLARSVAGVQRVRDRLQVAWASEVLPVQGPVPPLPLQFQPPGDKDKIPKTIMDGDKEKDKGKDKDKEKQPIPQFPPLPIPGVGPGGVPPGPGGMLEPMPIQGTPPGFPSASQPPPMPPYAWPTYAPYNNFARVAYPNLYPYESFPFIGPLYPFPQIPLGWRSVSLTWEDGHWWIGRNATGHDWWRIRYW
jgi:hypothetical protein